MMGVDLNDGNGSNRNPWSTQQIVDIAILFKYINVDKGNWLWLDFLMSANGPMIHYEMKRRHSQRVVTEKEVAYAFSKRALKKLLSKTMPQEYFNIFTAELLFFYPNEAFYAVLDTGRRMFGMEDVNEKSVMTTIFNCMSQLPTYEYIDACELKVALLKQDTVRVLDTLGEKILNTAPVMKTWLGDSGDIKINMRCYDDISCSQFYKRELTVKANVRLLEAAIFESFVYESVVGHTVPKRERFIRLGQLFSEYPEKPHRDILLCKVINATHTVAVNWITLFDVFRVCCYDFLAYTKNLSFSYLLNKTPCDNNRETTFVNIYRDLRLHYTHLVVADIMKSVCTLLVTPELGHALYVAINERLSKVGDEDDQSRDFRINFLETLRERCHGVTSALSWVETIYKDKIISAVPHTVTYGDLIYPLSLLERYNNFL
jgi:hypothetical protein